MRDVPFLYLHSHQNQLSSFCDPYTQCDASWKCCVCTYQLLSFPTTLPSTFIDSFFLSLCRFVFVVFLCVLIFHIWIVCVSCIRYDFDWCMNTISLCAPFWFWDSRGAYHYTYVYKLHRVIHIQIVYICVYLNKYCNCFAFKLNFFIISKINSWNSHALKHCSCRTDILFSIYRRNIEITFSASLLTHTHTQFNIQAHS